MTFMRKNGLKGLKKLKNVVMCNVQLKQVNSNQNEGLTTAIRQAVPEISRICTISYKKKCVKS